MQPVNVPGTHWTDALMASRDCGWSHGWEVLGMVDPGVLVHLAMSTVLRHGDIEQWRRDGIHRIQASLGYGTRVHTARRTGWPLRIIDGHDVTPEGLVTARHVARHIASGIGRTDVAYVWRQAAGLLGVTLP
jgi:hypothetical protein